MFERIYVVQLQFLDASEKFLSVTGFPVSDDDQIFFGHERHHFNKQVCIFLGLQAGKMQQKTVGKFRRQFGARVGSAESDPVVDCAAGLFGCEVRFDVLACELRNVDQLIRMGQS